MGTLAEIRTDPARSWVYEHGWQSWSPAGWYPADRTSPRPAAARWHTMGYRPGRTAPPDGFQGEGLLGVVDDGGAAHLYTARDPAVAVPSITAQVAGDRLVIAADGPVDQHDGDGLAELLTAWAGELAARRGVGPLAALPPAWCSWYGYWADVTEAHIDANLDAIDRLGLDVGVVQIDDGHQEDIGDWATRSPRFGPLAPLVGRIRERGRRAGLWLAPFLVGERSQLARAHPDWLVGGAVAAEEHWGQRIGVLDSTHPDAAEHLSGVFRDLAADGFTYYKLDFLYGGAMDGRRHADADGLAAYAEGLRLIREAVGPDATLLGCGAPLLPSVGWFDAMRVSPDIGANWLPPEGDLSQPSGLAATLAGRARGWMHGRFWINDPDCLMLRPGVERREDWAAHVARWGGLRASGDALDTLDEEGLRLTRDLLRPATTAPFDWSPKDALQVA